MGLENKATRIWKDAYPMYIIMEVPTACWLLQFTNLKGLAILGYLSRTKKSGEILTIWNYQDAILLGMGEPNALETLWNHQPKAEEK